MGEEDGRPDMVNRDPNGLNSNLVVSSIFMLYAFCMPMAFCEVFGNIHVHAFFNGVPTVD